MVIQNVRVSKNLVFSKGVCGVYAAIGNHNVKISNETD